MKKSELREIIREELLKEQSGGFIEVMDYGLLNDAKDDIKRMWHKWKSGPATEKKHINPAKKDLAMYFSNFIKGLR